MSRRDLTELDGEVDDLDGLEVLDTHGLELQRRRASRGEWRRYDKRLKRAGVAGGDRPGISKTHPAKGRAA